MAKTDKERLATGFWNRIESNQATDCNRGKPNKEREKMAVARETDGTRTQHIATHSLSHSHSASSAGPRGQPDRDILRLARRQTRDPLVNEDGIALLNGADEAERTGWRDATPWAHPMWVRWW